VLLVVVMVMGWEGVAEVCNNNNNNNNNFKTADYGSLHLLKCSTWQEIKQAKTRIKRKNIH
jgi:hypothetical protein